MNHSESLDYLFSLQRLGARMGTITVRSLLEAMGNPQEAYPSVLIAGTNGKGSTAAFLAAILKQAGIRAGVYTSPHLVRFEERIVVDGTEIGPAEVARLATELRACIDGSELFRKEESHPSFFETTTAMAFRHFQEQRIELAVLEVGMGGRLDATSVVDAITCLFTPIDLDHRDILGDTLQDIAAEKSGILKTESRAITAPQHPEVMEVLRRVTAVRGAALVESERIWRSLEGAGGTLTLVAGAQPSRRIESIALPLPGRHQWTNAVLAAAAATALPGFRERISDESIGRGLASATWPARCEVVAERPTVLLDGAHNPAAAQALHGHLVEQYTSSGRKIIMIFGAMQDKDLPGIMEPLFRCASRVILARAETPRAADPRILEGLARRYHGSVLAAPSLGAALSTAYAEAGPDDVICITGSLYLVGDVKAILAGGEPRSRQAL
ncbi:MAG TPA: folylpolyglutamate synthase/dihydrofolate synthase family protein [Candidatus Polarisedimenticolia bacterium]|nr:folylpolyglutamate synthase/dihydrofolate synthase family protein [Candidatus Polarisedimenticolia bacterium]